ncbi:hypothetical protein OIU76_001462 [Salix suchowensis]|nr:hypothetical protein OIU76_001462 [Salix suchowensis]
MPTRTQRHKNITAITIPVEGQACHFQKSGSAAIETNGGSHLIGTFTDGDLRRTLKASGEGIFKLTVGEMCNRNPRTVSPDAMAVEAMKKMESPPSPVQFLPVIKDDNILIGIVTLHGLVSAGL